jgi:hypothetical protein
MIARRPWRNVARLAGEKIDDARPAAGDAAGFELIGSVEIDMTPRSFTTARR